MTKPGGETPPADAPEKQMRDLIADLEASIDQFDAKLQAFDPTPPPAPAILHTDRNLEFPSIDPDVVRVVQSAPDSGTHKATDQTTVKPATDLLTQLASAANHKTAALEKAAVSDLGLRIQLDGCLRRIFDYLHQFSQHVNVLKPDLPAQYALTRDLVFRDVTWHDSSIDFRTEMHGGQALFHTVVLRARLLASAPLHLACPAKKLDAFKNDLAFLNIVIADEGRATETRPVPLVLSPEIPTQLHFIADLKAHAVVLRARNLGGLGLNAFQIAPAALDQAVLDELGLCLLGRGKQWPAAMKSIPFKPIT